MRAMKNIQDWQSRVGVFWDGPRYFCRHHHHFLQHQQYRWVYNWYILWSDIWYSLPSHYLLKACSDSNRLLMWRPLFGPTRRSGSSSLSLLSNSACPYLSLSALCIDFRAVLWIDVTVKTPEWKSRAEIGHFKSETKRQKSNRIVVRPWERCSRNGQVPTWGNAVVLWFQPLPQLSCGSSCPSLFTQHVLANMRKEELCRSKENASGPSLSDSDWINTLSTSFPGNRLRI